MGRNPAVSDNVDDEFDSRFLVGIFAKRSRMQRKISDYDPSWRDDFEKRRKRRFKLVKTIGRGHEEVIFSYPEFKSLKEGLAYIRNVVSTTPEAYGIVDTQNQPTPSVQR